MARKTTRLLDRVNEPSDLRGLSYRELDQLAQEIRETIIETVNRNGGHMASNLGVVELTIALHRVLQSPQDKIVWDTSNQCYTHKLLTGRRDRFSTIRTMGGLSGFSEPLESPHDIICAGHAGTGPSVALGLACSLGLQNSDRHVVAVIGDGALTAGSAYEALNNIVYLKPKNLILLLNDNGMSISDNIGWLTSWRHRITIHPEYRAFVEKSRQLAKVMPHGEVAYKIAKRLKNGLRGMIIPSMVWEEMGFKYLGPIDGHDIKELEKALEAARDYTDKPTFIHVITHKGRGYVPAEQNPTKYHQPSSPLGDLGSAPTYSKVFADTLIDIMQKDSKVVAVSAAMLEGTALVHVQKKFPQRVFDVGVAEQHAVSMAAGMAAGGLKPFVSIYSTFLQRAFDEIAHDVCLQNLSVVIMVDRAGIVGEDGKTHQGAFDISYLRCLPNMVLCAPKDECELRDMVLTAYKHNGPVAIRIPRGAGVGAKLDHALHQLPLGKCEVLREGNDVTLLPVGFTVYPALEAAEELALEGIECTVVNPRFIKPLDEELLLGACQRTGRVLTIEENVLAGGFGDAILELLQRHKIEDLKVAMLAMPDEFVEHGSQAAQRSKLGLDAKGIAKKVRSSFFVTRHSTTRRRAVSPATR